MESENSSTWGWIVGIVVVAAIIGLLLLARGPSDQDHVRHVVPTTVATVLA